MAVRTLTASMMIDSRFISFPSLDAIAETHVGDRDQEESNCDGYPKKVLHNPAPQNFTSNAMLKRFSSFTRSGVHPGTFTAGSPVLPPGGVTPPDPEKYGTLAARWLYSQRKVTYWLGM